MMTSRAAAAPTIAVSMPGGPEPSAKPAWFPSRDPSRDPGRDPGRDSSHDPSRERAAFTITSHNGSARKRRDEGRMDAFKRAYDQGYRRFQIDVVPIQGELVSMHSIFGRKRRLSNMDIETFRTRYPGVPTLNEVLSHEDLGTCHWNIEAKSIKALAGLRSSLRPGDGREVDPGKIMLTSQFRPRLLHEVARDFPQASFAAPLLHGGSLGIRFLGARRAALPNGRPYDCEQIWHPILRKSPSDRPVRQGWTVRRYGGIDRMVVTGAHAIVNSDQLVVRGAVRQRPPRIEPRTQLSALALGGGGWRGAFGGIGTVMYLQEKGQWDTITDVVGISGGSFAVAALSQEREPVDQTLQTLLNGVEDAARRVRTFVASAIVALGAMITLGVVVLDTRPSTWAPPWMWMFAPLVFSVVARCIVTLRWRAILRTVFGKQRLPTKTLTGKRRYAIGATGLHDGDLYAFTTDFAGDAQAWRDAQTSPDSNRVAVPIGDASLVRAVGRATSLPGLGQLGIGQLWLPHADHDPANRCLDCRFVPDRLVDGGISGIFGRGLMKRNEPTSNGRANVLVVDAGRRLVSNGGTSARNTATRLVERLSIAVLLARWLAVAIDVGYRNELENVRDGSVADGNRYWLVRLAEEEAIAAGRPQPEDQRRAESFEKLYALRDRVHKFSLMGANRTNANRTIAAAIAACALEFEEDPSIEALLQTIDRKLDRGNGLVDAWNQLPLL